MDHWQMLSLSFLRQARPRGAAKSPFQELMDMPSYPSQNHIPLSVHQMNKQINFSLREVKGSLNFFCEVSAQPFSYLEKGTKQKAWGAGWKKTH